MCSWEASCAGLCAELHVTSMLAIARRIVWRVPPCVNTALTRPLAGHVCRLHVETAVRPRVIRAGGIAAVVATLAGTAAATAFAAKPRANDQEPKGAPPIPPERPVPHRPVLNILVTYLLEPLGTLKRFLFLAVLFAPVILLAPVIFFGRRRTYVRRDEEIRGMRSGALWWFGLLVAQMERAGPTFVKLGQWAGSRHDLFPDELCEKFGKLHSSNQPHSMAHTRRVIERVFSRPFHEVFSDFDTKPLGIGAVGQVYRGTLRKEAFETENIPQDVAIKVLHPGVHRVIRRDLEIMRIFAAAINCLPGMCWVSLPEEVAVFSELMTSQLNLRHEALNLDRFRRNFEGGGGVISFPQPLLSFCTADLLVEQHIEAVPLRYFLEYGSEAFDRRIASLGLNAFLVSRC